jgi:hypothetical protein
MIKSWRWIAGDSKAHINYIKERLWAGTKYTHLQDNPRLKICGIFSHNIMLGSGYYVVEFDVSTKRITKKDIETAVLLCRLKCGSDV